MKSYANPSYNFPPNNLQCILKIEYGYELVTSTDYSYDTPLHEVALKGNIEYVNVLLTLASATIRVDAKTSSTKLHFILQLPWVTPCKFHC